MSAGDRRNWALDFLVIGAQKAGTTSLWQYLREHPRLRFPRDKERPLFAVTSLGPDDFAVVGPRLFEDVRSDSLLGTVSPQYMVGHSSNVPTVAKKIAEALPDVKLIALLRDPIERAVSSYLMAFRRGQETRDINTSLSDLLRSDRLDASRTHPTDPNSFVVAGEYGRMLSIYRELFPAERILAIYSEALADATGQVIDEVLEFLDLESGFRPDGETLRHFRGGRHKLLDDVSETLLFKFYDEEILPYMRGDPKTHKNALLFFMQTWNVRPDDGPPPLSAEVRARLEEHYRADARELARLGLASPWITQWDKRTA